MFSCPTCDYQTKVKGNLERHKPKCKKGVPKLQLYICYRCCQYTTENKAHFERHQESDRCKNHKDAVCTTLEEQVKYLSNLVSDHDRYITKLLDAIELPIDEEQIRTDSIQYLRKRGVDVDSGESLSNVRALRVKYEAERRINKINGTIKINEG